MTGNSNDRKKALIVSMLLFLVSGGGIFLFFVVQGSNDLIGKGKEFSYGAAAREGVSSFFKYIGGSSDEEKVYTSEAGKIRAEAKGLLGDSPKVEEADVSDWMAPKKSASSGGPATSVPRMAGGGLSGAVGGGGGGSRSSGGVSRFGEGSGLGSTKIGTGASAGEAAGKGTLDSLRRANTALGQGLNSGSAMTARAKWGSGFGEGSGKGGNLAYAGGGLVSLDKIKKGQVGNLKASYAAKPSVPDATPFERDKGAESKDANLNKVKQDAADAAAKAAKQAMAQSIANAAASGVGGTANTGNQNNNVATNPDGSTTFTLTPEQMANATGSTCSPSAPCVNEQGGVLNDTTASVIKDKNGDMTIEFNGTVTYPGQEPQPNREVWTMGKDGKLGKQIFP